MNTNQKRDAVRAAYPGEAWAKKVNAMKDSEVVAIYLRLKGQGKIKG